MASGDVHLLYRILVVSTVTEKLEELGSSPLADWWDSNLQILLLRNMS